MLRYLARTASSSISIVSTYIVFLQKCKKGKPSKTDLPSWKTISQIFYASDICISRNQNIYRIMLSPYVLWLHCNTKSAELNGLDAQKTSLTPALGS